MASSSLLHPAPFPGVGGYLDLAWSDQTRWLGQVVHGWGAGKWRHSNAFETVSVLVKKDESPGRWTLMSSAYALHARSPCSVPTTPWSPKNCSV